MQNRELLRAVRALIGRRRCSFREGFGFRGMAGVLDGMQRVGRVSEWRRRRKHEIRAVTRRINRISPQRIAVFIVTSDRDLEPWQLQS